MYRCQCCDTVFDRPAVHRWREPMPDGFREPCCQMVCPACGVTEQYFEEVDHCPKCSSYKEIYAILCERCRKHLAKRFSDFADFLTAEEEEQLDEWLDGRSVTERGRFK